MARRQHLGNHPQFFACSDKGLASWADLAILPSMAKARVIFKMKRIAEDDWQIEAHYPGVEIRHIKGLKSKIEVDE
jgi:hypothetical protein